MSKTVLVCGGAGFIGHHLARRLKNQGNIVVVADIKPKCEYASEQDFCHLYHQLDLRSEESWRFLFKMHQSFDEVYQLAADMGGAGYIFTGENDADVMLNSGLINLLCAVFCNQYKARVFFSSSACVYPQENQQDPDNPECREETAYPANPDSEYGWEKIFSERLYRAFGRNYDMDVRICRFHNVFGPEGTWTGGKEKAPAAACRKVAEAEDGDEVEVWGPGTQTRSFLYIDDALDAVQALMRSDVTDVLNIGSEEMVSINELHKMVADIAGKNIKIKNVEGPVGVNGRNSNNDLIKEKLGWEPKFTLQMGLEQTYFWIEDQVKVN